MIGRTSQHLTEHQIAELLIGGTVSPEVHEHIATCQSCRQQKDVFHQAVGDFNSASLRWIEARPIVSLRQAASLRVQRTRRLAYASALAAAVAVGLVVPIWMHGGSARDAFGSREQATASDSSSAQIARDNELLNSVDVALSDGDPSPLRQFGIDTDAGRTHLPDNEARDE